MATARAFRQEVDPGVSPVVNTALPKINGIAYPGPYNDFTPFNMTAFQEPQRLYAHPFDANTEAMSKQRQLPGTRRKLEHKDPAQDLYGQSHRHEAPRYRSDKRSGSGGNGPGSG